MYSLILSLHSTTRWLVLIALLYAVFNAFRGLISHKLFTSTDNRIRHWTATLAHIQLVFGFILYFISPIIDYFLNHFKDAVHIREIRFFGMEHSLMMLIAVLIITIGSIKAKRKKTDREKFKTLAIWYTVALIIILANIPWPFSPLTHRPYWRGFGN